MGIRSLLPLLLPAVLMTGLATPLLAQGIVTQEEALMLAVTGASWDRRTAYLSEEDIAAIERLAGEEGFDRRVLPYYVALQDGRPTHVAYFDAHRVRTLQEVVMVVVDGHDAVVRVEVLKFSEPPEYRAPEGWLKQFEGHSLNPGLSLKGNIVGMTGATLTAQAVTGAVRRILAVHAYLDPLRTDAGGDQ